MLPAQPNKSLMHGLEVLLALAQADGPVGVREIGRRLQMEPSRVQRLLGTLAHLGLAHRDDQRKYGVGPGIHVLAALGLGSSGLVARAAPIITELQKTGLLVALGVVWRDQVSYLWHGREEQGLAASLGHEGAFPAWRSSIGQVLVAAGGGDACIDPADLAADGWTPEAWQQRLALVSEQGWALVATAESGQYSLAVPVGAAGVPIAGLALSGVIADAAVPGLVERLQQAAAAL